MTNLPQQIDAEMQVLGLLIVENSRNTMAVISDILQPSDFSTSQHQIIYEAILDLYNKSDLYNNKRGFDIISVSQHLNQCGKLQEVGGTPYLSKLTKDAEMSGDITHYAELVKKSSDAKNYISIFERAALKLKNNWDETEKIVSNVEQKILDVGCRNVNNNDDVTVEMVDDAIIHIEKLCENNSCVNGLATWFCDIDEQTGGLQKGEFIIIAARPSVGKTALALNFMENIGIKGNQPTIFFSFETPRDMLLKRMLSTMGRVDFQHVKTGRLSDEEWRSIKSAAASIKEHFHNFIFVDDPTLTSANIRSRIRRELSRRPIAAAFVDYIQLVNPNDYTGDQVRDITSISKDLKRIPMEFDMPLVALSQLSRDAAKGEDKMPQLIHLRGSGSLEQDTDVVFFIHRPDYYDNASFTDPSMSTKEVFINIAKQRNGPRGVLKMNFVDKFMRFESVEQGVTIRPRVVEEHKGDVDELTDDIFKEGDF